MKINYYVGTDGPSILITQPTDIYTLLDWALGEFVEKSESAKGSKNVEKWEKASDFICELMELTDEKGFGNKPICEI